MQKNKKILALLLVAALTITQLPMTAIATNAGMPAQNSSTNDESAAVQIESFTVSTTPSSISLIEGEITGTVTAFDELPDNIRWQNTAEPTFPETVSGTVEGKAVQIPVTWQTEQDYDENAPECGFYVFDAVFAEGCTFAYSAIVPRITVYIPETVSRFAPFRMGGGGTDDSPLEITTEAQLAEIAELVNAGRLESFLFNDNSATVYLKLKNDLNLSCYGASFNGGKGWIPIGTYANSFKGHFDGNGNTITGLYINDRYQLNFAGLFGCVTGGKVENLRLKDISITGSTNIGGVVGYYMSSEKIQNCHVTGTVAGGDYVGGVAGYFNNNNTLQNCRFTGTITGVDYVGGVAGYLDGNAILQNCYTTGTIVGGDYVGGVAGFVYASNTVKNCYAVGTVTGTDYVGGIVGKDEDTFDLHLSGKVGNCAALNFSVTATSGENVGRILGYNNGLAGPTGNIAFSGMSLTANGRSKPAVSNTDGYDGADITATQIKADSTIGSRFTSADGWTTEPGMLPGFGSSAEMPAYIIDIPAEKYFLGEGTSSDPYQISTAAQLAKLSELVNDVATNLIYGYSGVYYKLTADIDLSGYGKSWNDGKGWVPIGKNVCFFRGNFDGGSKTITGLYINDIGRDYAGLFGYIREPSAAIHSLIVKDVSINAGGSTGGIAGRAEAGTRINSCSVSGTVKGSGNIGGVVGFLYDATMEQCEADVVVSGTTTIGGVAGNINKNASVTNCYSTGSVIDSGGANYGDDTGVGGVAGLVIDGSTVENCYSTSGVISTGTGLTGVGGVAGWVQDSTVKNCAALNPSVSGKSSFMDRVAGNGNLPIFSGNIAFSGMSCTIQGSHGDSGTSKTAEELHEIGNWPGVFNTAPWTYESGKLPGLFGKTAAMPVHIAAKQIDGFAGGSGSQGDPYQIATAAQLSRLAELVNAGDNDYNSKYYRLTSDIELSGYGKNYNDGKGWIPIGDSNSNSFKGHFDGNDKTVNGLYIYKSDEAAYEHTGLFGAVDGGTVKDLGVTNVSITGSTEGVGGVAGYVHDSSVKNCYATGSVSGSSTVGGVVGLLYDSTAENCYASGTVYGTFAIGGVVGKSYLYGSIIGCYAAASVSGIENVGGVAGYVYDYNTLENCYATGTVNGVYSVGGLVGNLSSVSDYINIINCYAAGLVKGEKYVGGLLGFSYSCYDNITNCAALNPGISGSAFAGRVAGYFYDGTLSNNRAFSGMTGGGTAKTAEDIDGTDVSTADIMSGTAFWNTTMGWDESVWSFQDGKLPTLRNAGGAQTGGGGLYLTERNIANATVNEGGPYIYTGNAIEPILTVTFDSKTLVKGVDYTVEVADGSASDGTNAGIVTVKLVGKGNFKGEKTGLTYTIQPKALTADMLADVAGTVTYTGAAQMPVITVTDGGKALAEDTDYSVTYADNINAGTAIVNVTGKDNYTGTVNKNFTIGKAPLTITDASVAKTYDGTVNAIVDSVDFDGLKGGEKLTLGMDYTVTDAQFDSADAGHNKILTGAVSLISTRLTNNYTLTSGNLSLVNQTIAKASAAGASQTLEVVKGHAQDYIFDLPTLLPHVTGTLGTITYAPAINENSDGVLGTLAYTSGNTLTVPVQPVAAADKIATISVTVFSTNYEDFTATITVKTIETIPLTVSGLTVESKTYDGTPAAALSGAAALVTADVQSGDVVELTGMPIAVFANADAGDGKTVTITGLSLTGKDAHKYHLVLSGFTGKITAKTLIDDMVALSGGPFTYTGMEQTPGVTAADGGKPLAADTDYTVAYTGNINAGTATVTVTGRGNYTGMVSKNFTIEKAAPAPLTWPNAAPITYGTALSTSGLSDGSATGTWAWTNETMLPPTGSGSYEVTFTPNDMANYDWSGVTLRQNVTVTVYKANGLAVSTQPSMNARESATRSYEFDMDNIALNKADTGARTYSAAAGTDANNILSNVQVDGSKLAYTISNTAAVENTATVIITISTANYEDVTAILTVTVTAKNTQTISFEDSAVTKTYGDAKFTQTAALQGVGGTGRITYTSDNTAVATVNTATGEVTIVGAGSANITAAKAADDDWYAATDVYGLTVSRKTVTITANDKTAKAGQTQPAYTYAVTGLVPGESLSAEPTVTCPLANMNVPGTYAIVPNGAATSANYVILYQNGTLTVNALSTACDVVSVISPEGLKINGTNITAAVANSVSSQLIGVTVSTDAAWALYRDMTCTTEITNKTMTLSVGANTAYIKVTAEDGMTAKIYTVTITRSASTGGGDSGGGSGSSSSDSDTTTTVPENKPDQPVTATATVNAAAGAGDKADTSIPDKVITDAIAKAHEEAEKQGKTANGIGVSLNVNMPDGTSSLSLTLSQAALQSLISANTQSLEIGCGIASLNLDLKVLNEIQRQSTGSITITIKPVQNLSAAAKKLIGKRPVYDVTISYVKDGKTVNITSLGKGSAALSFPYTPDINEAVGYLFGVYVDGKGNATPIPGSAYNANSRSIIFPAGHFSVYGVGYTAPAEKYADIANHWAKESIDYAVGRGLFGGTDDTKFSPDIAMDRGMLVTVLGRLAGADVSTYKTGSFSDVAAGKYYLPYVEWAYRKGIIGGIGGIGGGKFAPERGVTREEIALILQNYAKVTGYKLPATREAITYADTDHIGSVYKTAVSSMQQSGIMVGGSGSKFYPKTGVTRAEAAAMLHRYIKLTIDQATAHGWALNGAGQWLYYMDGRALTGTQTIDGTKYFFEANGTLKTGWVKDGSNWYCYFGNKLLTGWQDIGSGIAKNTYYFDAYGNMVSGKWLSIDGKWYYFNAGGSLARSTTIDGYEVDENGVRKSK